MPVHRVPIDDGLELAVEDIERVERITNTVKVGEGCVLVFTEPRSSKRAEPGAKETRAEGVAKAVDRWISDHSDGPSRGGRSE